MCGRERSPLQRHEVDPASAVYININRDLQLRINRFAQPFLLYISICFPSIAVRDASAVGGSYNPRLLSR